MTQDPYEKKRGQLKDNGYTHLLDSPIAEHNHQFSLLIGLISTGDPTKYSSLSRIDHWMNQSLIWLSRCRQRRDWKHSGTVEHQSLKRNWNSWSTGRSCMAKNHMSSQENKKGRLGTSCFLSRNDVAKSKDEDVLTGESRSYTRANRSHPLQQFTSHHCSCHV